MNTEPCKRPTWKLSVAFAGMCCLYGDRFFREFREHDFQWAWALSEIGTAGFGIWLAWYGIFRTAALQMLWGWICLLAGVCALGMMAAHYLGWLQLRAPADRLLVTLVIPVTGWLLVIDREVARYRKNLRKLEDARCKLRLED